MEGLPGNFHAEARKFVGKGPTRRRKDAEARRREEDPQITCINAEKEKTFPTNYGGKEDTKQEGSKELKFWKILKYLFFFKTVIHY